MRITESQLRRIIKEELDSNVETIQRMLRLDPWTFDQTPAGWSSLPADMQIDAMRAYVEGPLTGPQKTKAPPGRTLDPRTIIWHLGQVLAMRDQPGDRKEAIGWMMKSLKSADRQWNDYVKATIAFLSGDRESFDKHSAGENYNSNVLDRLRDGWGRSYSEVY